MQPVSASPLQRLGGGSLPLSRAIPPTLVLARAFIVLCTSPTPRPHLATRQNILTTEDVS